MFVLIEANIKQIFKLLTLSISPQDVSFLALRLTGSHTSLNKVTARLIGEVVCFQ